MIGLEKIGILEGELRGKVSCNLSRGIYTTEFILSCTFKEIAKYRV